MMIEADPRHPEISKLKRQKLQLKDELHRLGQTTQQQDNEPRETAKANDVEPRESAEIIRPQFGSAAPTDAATSPQYAATG